MGGCVTTCNAHTSNHQAECMMMHIMLIIVYYSYNDAI